MDRLVRSMSNAEWSIPEHGVREKNVVVGNKFIRLLEIDGAYSSENWCQTGHTGYVLEGSFELNIDGEVSQLETGSVFFVEHGNTDHKHLPTVHEGGFVRLLLVEEHDH